MNRWKHLFPFIGRNRERQPVLMENSPLRRLDPRAKLALSLAASVVVMLTVDRLILFLLCFALLLAWAKLLPLTARQFWRMRWFLLILFLLDWWLIDLNLAILVSLRLILLAGTFSVLVATTTFEEFRVAIERLGIPYRIAFSMGLAFQCLNLLEEEWQAIREAQQARGIQLVRSGLRETLQRVGDWVALTIPAVVLTTRRAWAVTESAHARGFDSPKRQAYRQLSMRPVDWLVILISFAFPWLLYWR
jgi:energy-coupling factor transporter transmembrane protein EcfT